MELLAEQFGRVRMYEVKMREADSDTTAARRDVAGQMALARELEQTLHDAFSTQSQLRMMCAAARPDEEIPGTIGIEVDSSSGIFWVRQTDAPGKESLTMFFGAKPPRVKVVTAGSPAEKAGVRAGDTWLSVNGRQLVDSVQFDEAPQSRLEGRAARDPERAPGGAAPVRVARKAGGAFAWYPADVCDSAMRFDVSPLPLMEYQMPVMMQPKPFVRPVMPEPQQDGRGMQFFWFGPTSTVRYGGATLEPLDDDWRESMGVQGDGVGVRDVAKGTPAAAAGLRKFDVIRQVNGEVVASPAAFQRIASEQRTLVLVVFNKSTGTRTVTLSRGER